MANQNTSAKTAFVPAVAAASSREVTTSREGTRLTGLAPDWGLRPGTKTHAAPAAALCGMNRPGSLPVLSSLLLQVHGQRCWLLWPVVSAVCSPLIQLACTAGWSACSAGHAPLAGPPACAGTQPAWRLHRQHGRVPKFMPALYLAV